MATVDPQYTYVQFTVNRPVYYFAQLSTELCTCGICNGIVMAFMCPILRKRNLYLRVHYMGLFF